MDRRTFLAGTGAVRLASPLAAEAQQAHVYRVGVILQGGPYLGAADGLRKDLGELGLEEGKQFVLNVREGKGDLKVVEEAAGDLEREKVDLIYSAATSVALVAKRAAKTVPIVFNVEAPRASEGDGSEAPPGGDILQSRQLQRSTGRQGRAGGSPPFEAGAPPASSRVGRGAAGRTARASGRGDGCILRRGGRDGG